MKIETIETYYFTSEELLEKLKIAGIEISNIHKKLNGTIVVEIVKERIIE